MVELQDKMREVRRDSISRLVREDNRDLEERKGEEVLRKRAERVARVFREKIQCPERYSELFGTGEVEYHSNQDKVIDSTRVWGEDDEDNKRIMAEMWVAFGWDTTVTTDKLQLWKNTPARHKKFTGLMGKEEITMIQDNGANISMVGRDFRKKYPQIPIHTVEMPRSYSGISGSKLGFEGISFIKAKVGTCFIDIIVTHTTAKFPDGVDILLGNWDLENPANQLAYMKGYGDPTVFLMQKGGGLARSEPPPTPQLLTSGLLWDTVMLISAEGVISGREESTVDWNLLPVTIPPKSWTTAETKGPVSERGFTSKVNRRDLPGGCYIENHEGWHFGEPQGRATVVIHNPTGNEVTISTPQWLGTVELVVREDMITRGSFNTGNTEMELGICTYCMKQLSGRGGSCGGCKQAYYCDTECQRKHWLTQHKLECKGHESEMCGMVKGSIGEVSDDSEQLRKANDLEIGKKARSDAETFAKMLHRSSATAIKSLKEKAIAADKENKKKMAEGAGPKIVWPTSSEGDFRYDGGAGRRDGELEDDGEEIREQFEKGTIDAPLQKGTHDLSAAEFLLLLNADLFMDGQGNPMYQTKRALFIEATTDMLRFRAAGVFRLNYDDELGGIKNMEYVVQIKEGASTQPFTAQYRRYSDEEKREICSQVYQLLRSGVLVPSRSAWSNRLVLASKPDGGLRMCMDFRQLNERTENMAGPLPNTNDVITESFKAGNKIFSHLDLTQAYHQLQVSQESQKYLAFDVPYIPADKLPGGQALPFQVTFQRLPFGLTDACTVFSNITREIFGRAGISTYMDDLAFGTHGVEGHIEKMRVILELAAKHGLTFGTKCEFYREEVKSLGHVINKEGIRLDPGRVEDLRNMASPTTMTEVYRWIGAINYCSSFLGPDYATILAPITEVVKNRVVDTDKPPRQEFFWGEEQERAIQELKNRLTSAPILKIFDNTLPTRVVTDGSSTGVGATLEQQHGEVWFPVMFMSKKLSSTQQRWGVSQYELFALILALLKWRTFLVDRPFEVVTDHQALLYLKGKKLFEGRRLARWQLMLAEFRFMIRHVPGKNNEMADLLSRGPFQGGLGNNLPGGTKLTEDEEMEHIGLVIGDLKNRGDQGRRKITANGEHPLQLVGWLQELVALANTTEPKFRKGDRVRMRKTLWNKDYGEGYFYGIVQNYCAKNKSQPDFWNIHFDDGDKRPIKGTMLEKVATLDPQGTTDTTGVSTVIPETPRESETTSMVDIQEAVEEITTATHTTDKSSFDSGGAKGKEEKPEETKTVMYTPTEGDLVYVSIYHSDKFMPLFMQDRPMGVIQGHEEITDRVKVKLFTEYNTVMEVQREAVEKIISKSEVEQLELEDNRTIEEGDLVMIKEAKLKAEITTHLKNNGITCSVTEFDGRLIGRVVDRRANAIFEVHFGGAAGGTIKLNTSDIRTIKKDLRKEARRALVESEPHELSEYERSLLRGNRMQQPLLRRVLVDKWKLDLPKEIRKDFAYGPIVTYLETGKKGERWDETVDHNKLYKLQEEILFIWQDERWLAVIPEVLVPEVLYLVHDLQNHFDRIRTAKFFEQYFYLQYHNEKISQYVGSCLPCQLNRNKTYFKEHYGDIIADRLIYSNPRECWAIDLKTVPVDNEGFCILLVMVDLAARFVITVPLKSKEAAVVASAIDSELILKYGSKIEIMADKGSEFTDAWGTTLRDKRGIKITFIGERTPQTNGLCERFNRVFNDHWKKAMVDGSGLSQKRWSDWVKELTAIYNGSYHREISNTPYFLHNKSDYEFDYSPGINTGISNNERKRKRVDGGGEKVTIPQLIAEKDNEYKIVMQLIRESHMKLHREYEIKQVLSGNYTHFSNEALVMIHLGDSNGGHGDRYRCHAGPFKIKERISNSQYKVYGADRKEVVVHAAKLLKYKFTYSDLAGQGRLAASAVGAAEARLLRYNDEDT